ncbi:MAG: hypothetical protein KF684_13390 [Phycisphaeraceae bacterium]|nr:hypothetical protein [Phycisphaeraceae bacterium]
MKTKGISIIEKHGEKAVVGAFALLALGVVAWQFVGSGNRVAVESNQRVEPDRAYESIVRRAQQITGQLNDPNPAAGIPEELPDAAELVRRRIEQGLRTPADRVTAFGPLVSPFGRTDDRTPPPEDARYAAVLPPAPTNPVVAQYLLTLDPLTVASVPSLAAVAPATQPHDLRAVSVQATFPASAFRAALESDPDGPGPLAALPRTFWLNRTAILGLKLERQRLNADGTLGPIERVPESPGSFSLLERLSQGMSPGEFQTVTRDARQNIAAIVQPAFPPSIAGDAWIPPAQKASATPVAVQSDEISRLLNQRTNLERNLEIEKGRQSAAVNEQARQSITTRIQRLEADIQTINQRLADLGYGGAPVVASPQTTQATPLPEARNIESADAIVLLAHDMTATPGETYRYRVSVGVANPLFPWASSIQEDQRAIAAQPIAFSEPSPWSEPIRVAPDAQAFVTRAGGGQEAAAVGGYRIGDITAEVFGLFYGHWRGASVRLNPGDALAATVSMPQGLQLFEIIQEEGQAPALGAASPVPETLQVAMGGAMLLDVIDRSSGAEGRASYLAVLRLPDGRLVLRDPAVDLQSPALQTARRSAQAGQSSTPTAPSAGVTPPGGATRPAAPAARPQQPSAPSGGMPGDRRD